MHLAALIVGVVMMGVALIRSRFYSRSEDAIEDAAWLIAGAVLVAAGII